ncbi:MAG: choice-of-anchor R domain-containing protein [Terriglobales bacterium]
MKKTLTLLCFFALCSLTLLAQTLEPAVTLKPIYNNLGSSKTDRYDDTRGLAVLGPNSCCGTQSDAMAFTPKSNSTVYQVQVAVVYNGGANQVNLSLYEDSGGNPGTLLAGPVTVTNLGQQGTCCTLAVANFTPVAITGGSQYWVVADTPLSGTGSDFNGSWEFAIQTTPPYSVNLGTGWSFVPSLSELAGKVLGTIQ